MVHTTYPELVLHERRRRHVKLLEQRPRLRQRQVLEASLKDAATVRMAGHVCDVPPERVDEGQSAWRHVLDDLLNYLGGQNSNDKPPFREAHHRQKTTYMIPISVLHAVQDVIFKLSHERALLLYSNVLDSLCRAS